MGGPSETISDRRAEKATLALVDHYGTSDLVLDEVIEFQHDFYVLVRGKDTGRGAFELLHDPSTGTVTPEPG